MKRSKRREVRREEKRRRELRMSDDHSDVGANGGGRVESAPGDSGIAGSAP